MIRTRMLVLATAALIVAWVVLLVRVARAPPVGAPGRPPRPRGAFLAVTVLAAASSCATPIVSLVSAFDEVARADPAEKSARLARAIAESQPRAPLALLAPPLLVVGVLVFTRTGRRRGAAAAPPAGARGTPGPDPTA